LNGKIKRPLIEFEKKDIIEYAVDNNLRWREDSSNKSNSYLRNKIRNEIIPQFDELKGNFLKNFKKTIKYLKMSNSLIYQRINQLKLDILNYDEDDIFIKISDLKEIDKEAFLYYFLRDYGFVDWDKIIDLLSAESGKKIFSKSHVFYKDKNKLILRDIKVTKNIEILIENLENNTSLEYHKILSFTDSDNIEKNNPNIITVDKQKLKLPLKLRGFMHGDFFNPYGMKGAKKVGKFLKDNNVSEMDRSSRLILLNGDDKIIWVVGMRLDERFSVKKESTKLLNIEYLQ